MKVKHDFVTNSSTTCFIFVVPASKYDESLIRSFDTTRYIIQELDSFHSMEQIIGWVQNSPVDWVNPIMGPREFYNLSIESYRKVQNSWLEVQKYKESLVLVQLGFERSATESQSFENRLTEYIHKSFGYVVTTESW